MTAKQSGNSSGSSGRSGWTFVVASDKYAPAALETLREVGAVIQSPPTGDAFLEALADADALLIRTATQVTEEVLAASPRLRVVGRGGVGADNIDLEACRRRGVEVVYTPGAATDAVADLTMGLMISVVRGLATADRLMREGEYAAGRRSLVGCEISGLTVGIIGLGRIGREVGRRCSEGFGARVLYNDIVPVSRPAYPAVPAEAEEIFRSCDVISLHVPLTNLTKRMIGGRALGSFRAGAVLLNTARGAVVETDALVSALASGHLGGAGLDVTDPEPLPPNHPLFSMRNVHVTAHIGAGTKAAQARMSDVVHDVIRVLRGEKPEFSAVSDR